MSVPEIITGDDATLSVTLKKNKATFAIPVLSTVTAVIISRDRSTQLSAEVDCPEAATGADWLNSLIIVSFTGAQTAILSPGNAILEVQVEDSDTTKKTSWFGTVKIEKGTIA